MKIFKEFLVDWKTTGAVAPTSRFTGRVVADRIDFARVRTVVELGPGTGSLTRELLGKLPEGARLVAVEINPRLVEVLRGRLLDPRLTVVEGSAAELPRILDNLGLGLADCIISALPFSCLSTDLREDILTAARSRLRPGGQMVSIQYQSHVLPRLLKKYFGDYQVYRSWLNLPPALIYTCARS